MFTLRFDLRVPSSGAPAREIYSAALDMAGWGEAHGCASVLLSEHHMSDDGYLPSPLVVASAMAARTTTVPIVVAVVILPLYQPIRLAEEMAVLDVLSGGRTMFVLAIGYRPEEYEMYGADFHRRGELADELLPLVLEAKSGAPFEHQGRRIQVTPSPVTPGGPMVSWGGGSVAAARRAGRHGINFFAQADHPELTCVYEAAAREAGHAPGSCILNSPDDASVVVVAQNIDQAWEDLSPYLMHDVRSYAAWNAGDTSTASLSFVDTAEELRREDRSHRVLTVEQAVEMVRSGKPLPLHPLIGGCPPELAWRYLDVVADRVLPAV